MASEAFRLSSEVSMVVTIVAASPADEKDAVAATVTVPPPSVRFASEMVIVLEPSALARAEIEVTVPLIRFVPLNSAFDVIVEIWSRSA